MGAMRVFHQSLLQHETQGQVVQAMALTLVRLDTVTGRCKTWRIVPPSDDANLGGANFHSAFYYEEGGRPFIGLLKTGAIIETLAAHAVPTEHLVTPMEASTIWILLVDDESAEIHASLLPGVRELGGYALHILMWTHRPATGSSCLPTTNKRTSRKRHTDSISMVRIRRMCLNTILE